MQSKPTVIIVDNSCSDHDPVSIYLACHGYPILLTHDEYDASEMLADSLPETILLDYTAGNATPKGFASLSRSINPYMPFMVMNGVDDIDLKAHAAGCRFFVKKSLAA